MLKLSTIFKVLAACALLMGLGLMVVGSDITTSIEPIIVGDGADYDLKQQLAHEHTEPAMNITAVRPDTKGDYTGPAYINPEDKQGGDDIGSAFDISGALPITTTGTTAGYVNDYDEVCPYSGSTSPDVVYVYTPTADILVDINLCNSAYDTKLYVYENDPSTLVDCNDDSCPGYMSELFSVPMNLGNDYYIVIDGYGSASGDYEMTITEVVPPVGRCCYGAEGLDCIDNTEAECAGLGGSWNGALTCTTPCVSAPPNDECANAIPVSSGETVDGSTNGANIDCPGVLDWNSVWYAVDAPFASNNIFVDYCGTSTDLQCIGIVVYAACDDCPNYIIADNYTFADCGDGSTNPNMNWLNMPGPGTYYLPVFTGDANCDPFETDFQFTLTVEEVVVTNGDNCSAPFNVKLPDDMVGGPNSDEFIDVNFTCGRVDDYDATCLGSYDGGEDMIYELDVSGPLALTFTLSSSSTWKGFSIDDECPDTDNTCMYKATGSSGDLIITNVTLATGFYYVQIDTWPSPDCIPEFTLTISPFGGEEEGDSWGNCVPLSGTVVDLPFTTVGYTPDGPGGCMYGPNRWYCYTPDITGMGTVSLCGSGYDTKLAVYDGVDPYAATMMGCNDDSPCLGFRSLQSELTDLAFVAGNTYLIEVGGYSSATGSGILNIEVVDCEIPPNDNCEDVTPVTLSHGVTETFTGDNTCATNQCSYFGGPHTWHGITLTTQMDVTLDYCTNSPAWGNAWLNLAEGCPCTGFTFAGSYDFSTCGDGNVTIVWDDLPAGTYYYPVMKDPGYGSVGPYTLHVVGMAPSLLTADPDPIDFGTQAAGSQGSTTLTLGADGPGDINFSISYEYSKNLGHQGDLELAGFAAAAPGPKEPYGGPENVPSGQKQGGDNVGSATVIAGLPHSSIGTTVGYVDDYDEACPYTGSTSPDVAYSFAPGADVSIDIDLCNSGYDTKVYVYENTVGNLVDCNDDACPGYRSELLQVPLTAGNTYYIIIDGYGGDAGDYELNIVEYTPPDPFECPPGAGTESEPCGTDVNGGCNMAGTPGFEPIACGQTICGTGWFDGSFRDTDWYTVEFFVETEVTLTGQAQFDLLLGFIDTSDCALVAGFSAYVTGSAGQTISVTKTCGPGVQWFFVGPQFNATFACGAGGDAYWVTMDCPEGPVLWLSADPTTGTVPGGGTLPITVSWDATDLTDGDYSAGLKFAHDGRAEKIVPVTITIGDVVPPDTLVLEPAIISVIMVNEVENVDGHIYIGDDLGWVNPAVTTVGKAGGGSIPCTQETIASYPGLTNPVIKLTFDLGDFAALFDEGLMWDCETRSYVVSGTDDGGAISAGDDFTYCGHTSGDLNLDGAVDISDLVFMVEYMFTGGPAPEVLESADVNGDGAVDVSDLVYFVDWMFMGGEGPQHN